MLHHRYWWSFSAEQGTTTIREDSAAYTVSASSLTMEVEAVTRVLHWTASGGGSQTAHATILIVNELAIKSGMESPDWHIPMFEIHHQWKFCSGHTGVKGIDRGDRLAGKATVTQVACVSEDLKC